MATHIIRIPFRYLEPAFFGGLLDDPLLFVRIRPLKRALLFDCGQIAHLAKRVVKPIDTVFISHAHMDHIMGVPTLVRHHHASPRPVDLYGPAGIGDRVMHLLGGFDWNLPEPTWFTLRVHEVLTDRIRHYSFPGPERFVRHFDGEEPRTDREIWSCRFARVEAEILDHRLPCLAFRLTERPQFMVDPERLAAQGFATGSWLEELKKRVWQGSSGAPLLAPRLSESGEEHLEPVDDAEALYAAIRPEQECAAIGYLTDIGFTPENRSRIEALLGRLTLLCSECTFLAADEAKARVSCHFCTTDLNELADRLRPRFLLPMHLSKSYLRNWDDLYAELSPPAGTGILRLPKHIVPPPITVHEVARWLRPDS